MCNVRVVWNHQMSISSCIFFFFLRTKIAFHSKPECESDQNHSQFKMRELASSTLFVWEFIIRAGCLSCCSPGAPTAAATRGQMERSVCITPLMLLCPAPAEIGQGKILELKLYLWTWLGGCAVTLHSGYLSGWGGKSHSSPEWFNTQKWHSTHRVISWH